MTRDVTALLAFCDGPHDVAFVRRVLRSCLKFQKVEWRFSDFPAPFNSLFKRNVERHAAADLSLDMAHKFYLPDHVLQRDDRVALLFNAGGNNRVEKVAALLVDYLPLLQQARTFPDDAEAVVSRSVVLFVLDADWHGAGQVRAGLAKDFAQIDGAPFLAEPWQVHADDASAAIAADIGAYVWRGENELGTLEDILMPIHRTSDAARVGQAENCIDSLFEWETEHVDTAKRIAERSRRQKALITLLGQRDKPGGSQNGIIGQTKTMHDADLNADQRVQAFAAFVAEFLDLEVAG